MPPYADLPVEISKNDQYQHFQSAHCESGVTSNLLRGQGFSVSEAMAFGIGSGIFFVHMPFVKVMGLPLTSYRSFPGGIFKKTCRRLGIRYHYKNVRNPLRGSQSLDAFISNHAVGVRANIYWLPYIPEQFRFQFNAHNFVVVKKEQDGSYLVSDPVLEQTSNCPSSSMTRARYSKGPLAPKGLVYFPKPLHGGQTRPLQEAIRKGIRETSQRMLYSPVPFVGTRGIAFLAKQIRKYPQKFIDHETRSLYLANVIRMQEEIGTGGAGFRFLYAAFLQEAAERLQNPVLAENAQKMTAVGNQWREFATLSAKFCKGRLANSFLEIPELLEEISANEKKIFQDLRGRYL